MVKVSMFFKLFFKLIFVNKNALLNYIDAILDYPQYALEEFNGRAFGSGWGDMFGGGSGNADADLPKDSAVAGQPSPNFMDMYSGAGEEFNSMKREPANQPRLAMPRDVEWVQAKCENRMCSIPINGG